MGLAQPSRTVLGVPGENPLLGTGRCISSMGLSLPVWASAGF